MSEYSFVCLAHCLIYIKNLCLSVSLTLSPSLSLSLSLPPLFLYYSLSPSLTFSHPIPSSLCLLPSLPFCISVPPLSPSFLLSFPLFPTLPICISLSPLSVSLSLSFAIRCTAYANYSPTLDEPKPGITAGIGKGRRERKEKNQSR